MIIRIEHNGKMLGLIIKKEFSKEGIEFFTPDEFSQQLAYMKRPSGYVITPHIHNAVFREVKLTQEVLIIRSGRIRIDFYDEKKEYVESRILGAGDVVLLAFGGHGLEILEEGEIIEVKQGPYVGEMDKTRFEPVNKRRLVIKDDTGK